jgi:hypothetical protein
MKDYLVDQIKCRVIRPLACTGVKRYANKVWWGNLKRETTWNAYTHTGD